MKCPFCDNEKFEPGSAVVSGTYWLLSFKPDASGLLARVFGSRKKTIARRCTRCGFVAIFTEGGHKPEKPRAEPEQDPAEES